MLGGWVSSLPKKRSAIGDHSTEISSHHLIDRIIRFYKEAKAEPCSRTIYRVRYSGPHLYHFVDADMNAIGILVCLRALSPVRGHLATVNAIEQS